ncbi:hypothetical protein RIF29_26714 [Crotalaria pallida]|uniref:Uncharacterized protein n=1 Tax=Crotalaria pallida TaxID=3830 RepID=A0AAN9ET12_CROPI
MKEKKEVREHGAAVLAGLMKGGDENLAKDFRDRAYEEENIVQKRRKLRENEASLVVLPDLLMELDGMDEESRLLTLVEGVLAANIFD